MSAKVNFVEKKTVDFDGRIEFGQRWMWAMITGWYKKKGENRFWMSINVMRLNPSCSKEGAAEIEERKNVITEKFVPFLYYS